MHWAIAIPFLACFASAAVLLLVYNPDPSRSYRIVFSWVHRVSGLCLLVLPVLAMCGDLADFRLHLRNVKRAWSWSADDVRWLFLTVLSLLRKPVRLPEQGKFNAGEKLNFMMVTLTVPLFILTGIMIWMPGVAFLSWLLHVSMAIIATPLLLGHLFMAMINPSTRVGLRGIFSGLVDRAWAQHHYASWYRENFETGGSEHGRPSDPPGPEPHTYGGQVRTIESPEQIRLAAAPPSQFTKLRCPKCSVEHVIGSIGSIVHSIFEAQPMSCPWCGRQLDAIGLVAGVGQLDAILRQLERGSETAAAGQQDRPASDLDTDPYDAGPPPADRSTNLIPGRKPSLRRSVDDPGR
ncbi:MAG: cytochrome b/b6 domain-containing protein [Acidobacteriota bacterium]|nr:MAG: cytochrome b/b6 domain-containing protein [Acidobacteriota bacterium]